MTSERVDLLDSDGDAHIKSATNRTLVLQQPAWDDLRVELSSVRVPSEGGPGFEKFKDNGAGSTGVFLYWFDAASVEQVYFNAQFPHNQFLNAPVIPHIHWTPKSNGTAGQKVSWGLEYAWTEIGQTFGNTSIVYSATRFPNDSALVAGKHYITSFGPIAGKNGTVSNVLVCRLFRDATGAGGTDDYAADAGALYFDFHYQVDTLGSRTELAK